MTINIDDHICEFEKGETILEIAKREGIYIPTLCYLKGIINQSSCRICMVEDVASGKLFTACSTEAMDGQRVLTNSAKVRDSRTQTLKLFLQNHDKDCLHCKKFGACQLQKLFNDYQVSEDDEVSPFKAFELDTSSPCIVRDPNKCILCAKCESVCTHTQSVSALTKVGRGYKTTMGTAFNKGLKNSTCVGCGQCSLVCPTGALVEKSEVEQVKKWIYNGYKVYAQVAPSVRVALAENFGRPIGTFDEGKMVSALKMLGFEKVFDINLGADFTVIEEGDELLERVKENRALPQFSSCCPAWFKFVSYFYPKFEDNLSSCKSPTEMLGAIVKNYYSNKEGIDKEKIKVVGIMPCTAKKGEKERAKDVDASLTTRELADWIMESELEYNNLTETQFDTPLSYYSGAGLIFGATGGVTEAVLRYALKKLNPKAGTIDFMETRHGAGIKEVDCTLNNTTLKLCIVSGLANARKVMDDIVSRKKTYHFMEVMACPGGCVNGGGQSYVNYEKVDVEDVKFLRANTIYSVDKGLKDRISSDNITMQNIYKEFFIPTPNKAKQLLHWRQE